MRSSDHWPERNVAGNFSTQWKSAVFDGALANADFAAPQRSDAGMAGPTRPAHLLQKHLQGGAVTRAKSAARGSHMTSLESTQRDTK